MDKVNPLLDLMTFRAVSEQFLDTSNTSVAMDCTALELPVEKVKLKKKTPSKIRAFPE